MKRRILIASPIGLAGCGSLLPRQAYVARVDWPLDPPAPGPLAPAANGPVLLVRDFTAAPGLDDQGLHALRPDGSLDVSYYNRWAAPPADAATAAMVQWALASGAFAAVVTTGSRLLPSMILEGELTQFAADFAANQAVAVLTLVVISNGTGFGAKSHLLGQTRITGHAMLAGSTPPAEVAALRAALADALGQAVAFITRSIPAG